MLEDLLNFLNNPSPTKVKEKAVESRVAVADAQLSKFERDRMQRQSDLEESAWHAFDEDAADWGAIDPREWFRFVEFATAWNAGLDKD